MKYNQLGKSDLQASEISYGCMSLQDDHAANARLLHQAFDQGINYFDTADLYQKGENEISVGKAFKGRRSNVLLATKVGNQLLPDGSTAWNASKAYILQAVEQSLRRLQTDYIDLYQLHGGTLDDPIDDTIAAFEQLQQEGKIRYYGISSIRPNVIREYMQRSTMVSVMTQYSLLDRRPEEETLKLLHEHSISVLVRGSYAQGLLLGKPAKEYLGYSAEEVSGMAAAVRTTADELHAAPAQVAARFVLDTPGVASAVVGIRTAEQLAEALRIEAFASLPSQARQTLELVLKSKQYEQHR
ncbi:aldo/keto reductase [Hymenobacter sp. BT507]|uniref:Aldo/keto reductase n=1 Tax=Hymenobacter citatus TaxID=2763506 RepID=A0ABR7MF38_9BACT|nr:aldo/keto reductase [Hymenobacter citatus]MBC6609697.1 aldo/keto reductase [Hymenobacter citatus]